MPLRSYSPKTSQMFLNICCVRENRIHMFSKVKTQTNAQTIRRCIMRYCESHDFLSLYLSRAQHWVLDVFYFERTDRYNDAIKIFKTNINLSQSILKFDYPTLCCKRTGKMNFCSFFGFKCFVVIR